MVPFHDETLTSEEAFWVMWYFLQEHYELSEGTFDVSDILSACQPVTFNEQGHFDFSAGANGVKAPSDSGMVHFWNDAVAKFRKEGIPDTKKLRK